MISALHSYLLYITKVGIYHECHQTLMWILSKFSNGGMVYLGNFMRQQVEERQEQYVMGQSEKDPARPDDDFLTKLLRLHAGQPQKFSLEHVYTTCGTNIGAGSDTTSVSLAGILNCLIRNPATLRRVNAHPPPSLCYIITNWVSYEASSTRFTKKNMSTNCCHSKKPRSYHTSRPASKKDCECIRQLVYRWCELFLKAGRQSRQLFFHRG